MSWPCKSVPVDPVRQRTRQGSKLAAEHKVKERRKEEERNDEERDERDGKKTEREEEGKKEERTCRNCGKKRHLQKDSRGPKKASTAEGDDTVERETDARLLPGVTFDDDDDVSLTRGLELSADELYSCNLQQRVEELEGVIAAGLT